MRKATKIWLIVASAFLLTGLIIFGGMMTMLKWDFKKLSTTKYETNSYEINETYKNISIDTNTADIVFVPSENENTTVTCYEEKNIRHLVSVKDGTLVIERVDTRKWYEHIGINFSTPKITVSLPLGEYGALSVRSSTGDTEIPKQFKFESIDISASTGDTKCYASASSSVKINLTTGNIVIDSITAGALHLSVSTGNITASTVRCEGDIRISVSTGKTHLKDVLCNNLMSNGSTGDIFLTDVIATEKLSVQRSTGDVKFERCDAERIYVNTDTGDVSGTLRSEKVFIPETDTGKIDVPKTTTGGRCEITTDTGDIRIAVQK